VGQSPTWFAFSTYHHAPDHFKRVWQCFVRGFNHSTANRISLCPLLSFLRIIVDYFCHLVYVFTRMIIVQNLYCIRKNLFYRFPYPSRSVSHYTQPYIPFRYQSRLLHLYQAFLHVGTSAPSIVRTIMGLHFFPLPTVLTFSSISSAEGAISSTSTSSQRLPMMSCIAWSLIDKPVSFSNISVPYCMGPFHMSLTRFNIISTISPAFLSQVCSSTTLENLSVSGVVCSASSIMSINSFLSFAI